MSRMRVCGQVAGWAGRTVNPTALLDLTPLLLNWPVFNAAPIVVFRRSRVIGGPATPNVNQITNEDHNLQLQKRKC
jgi:hypothetical protein